MRDWKGNKHVWPKRGPTERRLHPRVRLRFPVRIDPGGDLASHPGIAVDLSLGGLKVTTPQFLELFTRVDLYFSVPVTNREGELELHELDVQGSVVRVEPDEPVEGDEEGDYETSFRFIGFDAERDRLLGTFMLQALLFDPGAELT